VAGDLRRANYFLELMDHGLSIERRVREGLLDVGRKLGIPPLATNDCHYVTREASTTRPGALCIQTGKTLSDPNRSKFDGDGYYLKSAADARCGTTSWRMRPRRC
jgi:DNA polymerase-3 subunit alpha